LVEFPSAKLSAFHHRPIKHRAAVILSEGLSQGDQSNKAGDELTWSFLSFIGPEPAGYAIVPSTVRVSGTVLVTTIRRLDSPPSWIDAYASHDDGKT
jgi:hypothetical protein